MTPETAKKQAAIDTPKEIGGYTLYPIVYGLVEWLELKGNPTITGKGTATLKSMGELCFAFTKPSIEICSLSDKQLADGVKEFVHSLDPMTFLIIQKHAQTELLKFEKTTVVPKKKPTHQRVKVARK